MSDRRGDLAVGALFAMLFALFAAICWQKGALVTADSARELYVPFQLRHGEWPYRDFYYLYGPVAPGLYAGLLWLFGDCLAVLYAANLANLAVIMGVLYALARQLLRPLQAGWVLFLFFTLFALGRDIWGYIWPYSSAATLGVLFGLAMLLGCARTLAGGRLGWLVLSGAMIGLSVVTKLEYGFAAAATGGLFWALRCVLGRSGPAPRVWWQELLALGIPAGAIAGAVAGVILSHMSVQTVLASTWPVELMRLWNSTGNWHGSWSSWHLNGLLLVAEGVLLGAILLHERLYQLVARGGPARWVSLAGLAVLVSVLVLARRTLGFVWDFGPVYWAGTSFVLLFAILAGVAFRLFRAHAQRAAVSRETLLWGLVAAYGCLVASRTLMTGYNDYTRYQAPVALIAWVALVSRWIPGYLAARGWLARGRRPAMLALGALALMLGARVAIPEIASYLAPHVAVSSPVGCLLAQAPYGAPFNQALAFVKSHIRPGERIVAAPGEASLYLFSGLDNPLMEDQLFYGYLVSPASQRAAIARMQSRGVRYILISNYGFGDKRFGQAFMRDLDAWIHQACRPVADYGNETYRIRIWETPFTASPAASPASSRTSCRPPACPRPPRDPSDRRSASS